MLFYPLSKCIIFWHDILIGGSSYKPEQYRKTLESLEAL